ncbi:sulfate transporter CysZ [Crenothrix polyspora]|uniref:Protein CysZ homolog n=1 Tax=Crenothrix polyspora TaxID=360316 RepID=A0A1R4GYC7_9GAMM|nr:sulfate transporter CysZ [Crenothrix polyspora]SJM89004.1 Protein CysZ homolog [Crenothrix polyspora]
MLVDKKANNPAIAIGCFLQGIKLLGSAPLRRFVIMPVLINIVLYSIAFALGYFFLGQWIDHFIPNWLQWLRWLLWPLFFSCFFGVLFFSFMLLANVLAAPFYGRLSAKTLAILTGQTSTIIEPPVAKVLWAELKRGLYFAIKAIPLLIISFIPGVNVIAPILWLVFGAWSMALEYTAYPMENAGLLFSQQKKILRSVRLGASSFGGIAALALTIPVLNFIVAPAAVVGATLFFNRLMPHRH